jgi:hypothetical protein
MRRCERTGWVNHFDNNRLRTVGRIDENDMNIVILFLACELDDCCRLVHPELLRKRSSIREIGTMSGERVQRFDSGGNNIPKIDASRIGISKRLDRPSLNAAGDSRCW